MTATDVLRRLLDERGVEWWPMHDVEAGYYQDRDTEFVIDGKKYTAHEWGGKLAVYNLTPEQAIAATLGSCNCSDNCTNSERTETCNADETDTWECVRDDLGGYGKKLTVHVMECTECGHVYEHVNGDYEFCPRCGRKRRDVEE